MNNAEVLADKADCPVGCMRISMDVGFELTFDHVDKETMGKIVRLKADYANYLKKHGGDARHCVIQYYFDNNQAGYTKLIEPLEAEHKVWLTTMPYESNAHDIERVLQRSFDWLRSFDPLEIKAWENVCHEPIEFVSKMAEWSDLFAVFALQDKGVDISRLLTR